MVGEPLPAHPFQPWYGIEMLVPAQKWQRVLARQSRDPEVIRRNRPPLAPKFLTDLSVSLGRRLIHSKYQVSRNKLCQPLFVPYPLARLTDSVTVLAERNHRHGNTARSTKNRRQRQVAVR